MNKKLELMLLSDTEVYFMYVTRITVTLFVRAYTVRQQVVSAYCDALCRNLSMLHREAV